MNPRAEGSGSDPRAGAAAALARVVAAGGVAVFPADTVYGLACSPSDPAAVERLYALKGRPPAKPAAVMYFSLVPALAALPELGPRTVALLRGLLPGGVTVLLGNPHGRFPLACGPDPGTLGLRVPDVPLLAGVGIPVLQSSANLAGGPDARRLADVPDAIRGAADLVIDGGELAGTPSTVIDLRGFEASGAVDRRPGRSGAGGGGTFNCRTRPGEPLMTELQPDYFDRPLAEVDPEVADALDAELDRQQRTLEMIASENFVPQSILECQGCVLTNKYAEGYPGKRYYGGCEYVDVIEQLAIDRAKALFGAEHANVQPHAGAQANATVYHALLQPGDTIMGLALPHGGHLTHGMKINVSGPAVRHRAVRGRPRDRALIDMDVVEQIAHERRPKLILAGWSAYPRFLDFERFRAIADDVGALLMVDMAHFAGLVAAGRAPEPGAVRGRRDAPRSTRRSAAPAAG